MSQIDKTLLTCENPNLSLKINEWLKWDRNELTLTEVRGLVDTKDWTYLEKILLERMAFGTAGLRGQMCAGYSCMNDLVIVQTGQGMLKYLEGAQPDRLKKNGVVIGYDGRHNSKRFAELTASIFLHKGYEVKLFSDLVPTPFVPFSVVRYQCAAGIMVTASHNPKEDNGYKVYAFNGAQILSPSDKQIQEQIEENLEPLDSSWDTSILKGNELNYDPLEEVMEDYMKTLKESILDKYLEISRASSLEFTYTAMHGVGYNYILKAMELCGLKVVPVKEQVEPDPDFPTVKFPNPEEGKSSLDLSFKTAEANGSSIILANDPDADRLAVAEKNKSTGDWKVFNGNELGALFGWWAFKCGSEQHPIQDLYMLCSTVSSKILRTMSRTEGFNFVETLTGFKYMGNKAYEIEKARMGVPIFAFEEAIGFMYKTMVLDKDGVSAAAHMATMCAYLYNQNSSLHEQLENIYKTYGHHVSCNSYFLCYDKLKINAIFERIRNFNGPDSYPSAICDNKYEIVSIRDLTTGYDSSQADKKAILPVSKSSHMITFEFKNGLVATLRTSGTEPKIKYYTELCAPVSQPDRAIIEEVLKEMVQGLIEEMLQPKQNGLIPKSD